MNLLLESSLNGWIVRGTERISWPTSAAGKDWALWSAPKGRSG